MGGFQNIMEVEISDRNKYLNAIRTEELRTEENQNAIDELKTKKRQLENESREIINLQKELQDKFNHLQHQFAIKKRRLFKSLLPARIQQFERFQADESHVGDQCAICMEDVEIGRNMMRLDCDGQHTFCQVCIEGWFAEHNTCPICRHIFE